MASQGIPNTQRAWLVVRRGKPNYSLKLSDSWRVPKQLKENEVLVKVQAAALNPVGWKFMKIIPSFVGGYPHVAEFDYTGIIVDSNGTRFQNGDPIFGWVQSTLPKKTRQGALAQYIRVPADHLVIRPNNVTPTQAAGFALAGLTAYQALHEIAGVEAGQRVLVSGGSTAVGAFAIQIAKAAGATVHATASGRNEAYVRNLGADEFTDYTKVNLPKFLTENQHYPKYNIIFDAVGDPAPDLYNASAGYLAPNGVFVTTGPLPHKTSAGEFWKLIRTAFSILTPRWLGGVRQPYKIVQVTNKQEDLEALQRLIANGTVKPIVDSVFSFEDTLKAYERIMTTRATGKVVVKVDNSVD